MNIWSIDKDSSIKLLLLRLDEIIDLEQFCISISTELNAKAVRFCDAQIEGLSAYIYSYGQVQDHYGIHLELPVHADASSIYTDVYENISFERLVDVVKTHFNLL